MVPSFEDVFEPTKKTSPPKVTIGGTKLPKCFWGCLVVGWHLVKKIHEKKEVDLFGDRCVVEGQSMKANFGNFHNMPAEPRSWSGFNPPGEVKLGLVGLVKCRAVDDPFDFQQICQ